MDNKAQSPIVGWDDIDDELGDCVILADLVWDMVTDVGYEGPRSRKDLDRLYAVAKALKVKLARFDDAMATTELRKRGHAA